MSDNVVKRSPHTGCSKLTNILNKVYRFPGSANVSHILHDQAMLRDILMREIIYILIVSDEMRGKVNANLCSEQRQQPWEGFPSTDGYTGISQRHWYI